MEGTSGEAPLPINDTVAEPSFYSRKKRSYLVRRSDDDSQLTRYVRNWLVDRNTMHRREIVSSFLALTTQPGVVTGVSGLQLDRAD